MPKNDAAIRGERTLVVSANSQQRVGLRACVAGVKAESRYRQFFVADGAG
ncbi:MAG TPA: hypothetical protein VMT39_03255 [Candidatus Bathyarchaeia archaeon]|nr:hypothetical protein [Candidatus Bathyarchaeia archaeon]